MEASEVTVGRYFLLSIMIILLLRRDFKSLLFFW